MRTCGQGPRVFVRWLPRRSHTVTSFASTEQQRVQALDGEECEKCDRLGNHLFRRAAWTRTVQSFVRTQCLRVIFDKR